MQGQEVAKCLQFGQPIAHWLKEANSAQAGDDLIVQLTAETQRSVDAALQQLITSASKSTSSTGELSNMQLRYILSLHQTDIWALALKEIVCKADNPSVLSKSDRNDLVAIGDKFSKNSNAADNIAYLEMMSAIMEVLNNLNGLSFKVLGEFCSLIRDCSAMNGNDVIAKSLAWDVLGSGKANVRATKAAEFIFGKLVFEADKLFGQYGAVLGPVGFGVRGEVEVVHWIAEFSSPEEKLKQHLRTFYSYFDKKFLPIVDDLIEYHEFAVLAEGIYNKYGLLPTVWKSEAFKRKKAGEKGFEWFDYRYIQTPTPGATNLPKTRQIQALLPAVKTPSDSLVDIFIDSELNYYKRIGGLGNYYFNRVYEIAHRGEVSRQALRLSVSEIHTLFGQRFQKVLDFSHQLLIQFEVINLTRKNLKKGYTRAAVLAKIICNVAPDQLAQAYSDYSKTYPSCSQILSRKLMERENDRINGVPHQQDFIDLWNIVRDQIPSMQNKTFKEVLDLPLKRIHNYREMLKSLVALAPPGSPTAIALNNALNAIGGAANQLTQQSTSVANAIQAKQYQSSYMNSKSMGHDSFFSTGSRNNQ